MKERPILFKAPMVRAILDGSKTMTRRIIKPQPTHFNPAGTPRRVVPNGGPSESICCPYGEPGERLWCREAFGIDDEDGSVLYFADPDTAQDAEHARACEDRYPRRRPSIHMPRWASRILLEITDVRVERLQDISEADCAKEGAPFSYSGFDPDEAPDWRGWYRHLWESIKGPDSWVANPWVWVVEFRRIES